LAAIRSLNASATDNGSVLLVLNRGLAHGRDPADLSRAERDTSECLVESVPSSSNFFVDSAFRERDYAPKAILSSAFSLRKMYYATASARALRTEGSNLASQFPADVGGTRTSSAAGGAANASDH
jgi:hypothetical protein